MQCLSVLQPWASLIVLGAKRLETRSWRTSYRGLLAIHAGRKFPDPARALCLQEPFRSVLLRAGIPNSADLPLGKVIGYVQLVGCVATDQLGAEDFAGARAHERAFGDYRPGRWAWACLRPAVLPVPLAYPGKRGLFDVPDHLFSLALDCNSPFAQPPLKSEDLP